MRRLFSWLSVLLICLVVLGLAFYKRYQRVYTLMSDPNYTEAPLVKASPHEDSEPTVVVLQTPEDQTLEPTVQTTEGTSVSASTITEAAVTAQKERIDIMRERILAQSTAPDATRKSPPTPTTDDAEPVTTGEIGDSLAPQSPPPQAPEVTAPPAAIPEPTPKVPVVAQPTPPAPAPTPEPEPVVTTPTPENSEDTDLTALKNAVQPSTIKVFLYDNGINFSTRSFPSGPVELQVQHLGKLPHELLLTGPEGSQHYGKIVPSDTKTIRAVLSPGQWVLSSPRPLDVERGLSGTMTAQ